MVMTQQEAFALIDRSRGEQQGDREAGGLPSIGG
jgi:hypothetical protein